MACVGLGNPAGFPRFTFGNAEMTGGIGMIAMMIGMFAISEVIRFVVDTSPPAELVVEKVGNVLAGQWELAKKYPVQILRGSVLGTAVGALPGAGADIAAWMSYAMSKKFSQGAGEVRHRPRRRHRRIGLGQQQRAGRRLDPGAGVRHPGRLASRPS